MWILALLLTMPGNGPLDSARGEPLSLQDEEPAEWQFRAYAGGGVWMGFWKFDVDLGTRTATLNGDFTAVVDGGVSLGHDPGVEFFAEYEFNLGEDFSTNLGIIGVGYTWRRFGEFPGTPMGQRWNASLGLLAGTVTINQTGFPGEFDMGIGAQVTVEYRLLFTEHFAIHLQGGARYAQFTFNPTSAVVSSDNSLGGVSTLLTLGADWTF